MQKFHQFIAWMKQNPFAALLIIILIGLIVKNQFGSYSGMPMAMRLGEESTMAYDSYSPREAGFSARGSLAMGSAPSKMIAPPMPPVSPDSVDISQTDRKVVKNASMSTLVKSVRESVQNVSNQIGQFQGFVVSSYVNQPEQGGSATLSVRVKSDQLERFMQFVRDNSLRVINENVDGQDVTDQYTDSQARLATLEQTIQIFKNMLSQASTVEEIMDVQERILQTQAQIDQVKGQIQYLEATSDSSLITLYFSTDELSLPYSPSDPWRPQVVFKTAVRSLMLTLRGVANWAIWIAVYSPIIIAVIVAFWLIKKLLKRT